ncbi:hypothetical protein I4U23_017222 [Adineta vaga]|nr:hypothetical protein I4U23_017222 [Adineta vaga]
MSSSKERVFVIGASGNIGSGIVRGLVKKQIDTTAYVRDEQKAKDLFKDELVTGHLTIVVGTYSSIDLYTKVIQGHTRLFILLVDDDKNPAVKSQNKEIFGKIAFEQGVRQIVDLSSFTVRTNGKQGIIGYINTTAEEKLWTLAEENPEQRSLVVLRPAVFMTNHFFTGDTHNVKNTSKLVSCGPPSALTTWVDPQDVYDCAVVILTEPVEKHDRYIYEIGGEVLSNEQRAAVFTKVLGKPIIHEQQSIEDFYKAYTGFGLTHSYIYDVISLFLNGSGGNVTPQLAILINRPLRTLEQWLENNIKAFQ